MIEQVGYTDDGMVWADVRVQFEDKTATLKLIMTPDNAKEVRRGINTALENIENVRKSPNPDKSGTEGN